MHNKENKLNIKITGIICLLLMICWVIIAYGDYKAINSNEYLKVFYPDKNVEYWLIKEIEPVTNIEEFIYKLIKDKDLMIPNDVKLNNCYIEDGTLYVDFDEKFVQNEGDYIGDRVVVINVYSIVNSVCLNEEFNVNDVVFLIDGFRERTIGPLINYENFKPDASLSGI